jgi:hypothetical protein
MVPTSVIIEFFAPSGFGFLWLVIICISATELKRLVVPSIVAVVLHLLTVLVLVALAGMGHAWGGSESSFPMTYCVIGFAVLAVPVFARLAYESYRSSK